MLSRHVEAAGVVGLVSTGGFGYLLKDSPIGRTASVRRWTETAFAPPVAIGSRAQSTAVGSAKDFFQDAAGRLHLLAVTVGGPGSELTHLTSDDGRRWRRHAILYGGTGALATDVDARVAAADDHAGVVVWARQGRVSVDRIGPISAAPRRPRLAAAARARIVGTFRGQPIARVTLTGRVAVALPVSRPLACTGTVRLSLVRGSTVVPVQGALRVRPDCTFDSTQSVPRSVLGSAPALRLLFSGNAVLTASSAQIPIRLR